MLQKFPKKPSEDRKFAKFGHFHNLLTMRKLPISETFPIFLVLPKCHFWSRSSATLVLSDGHFAIAPPLLCTARWLSGMHKTAVGQPQNHHPSSSKSLFCLFQLPKYPQKESFSAWKASLQSVFFLSVYFTLRYLPSIRK